MKEASENAKKKEKKRLDAPVIVPQKPKGPIVEPPKKYKKGFVPKQRIVTKTPEEIQLDRWFHSRKLFPGTREEWAKKLKETEEIFLDYWPPREYSYIKWDNARPTSDYENEKLYTLNAEGEWIKKKGTQEEREYDLTDAEVDEARLLGKKQFYRLFKKKAARLMAIKKKRKECAEKFIEFNPKKMVDVPWTSKDNMAFITAESLISLNEFDPTRPRNPKKKTGDVETVLKKSKKGNEETPAVFKKFKAEQSSTQQGVIQLGNGKLSWSLTLGFEPELEK